MHKSSLSQRVENVMPCYHPIEVAIRRKTLYTDRKINDLQIVPCGNCIGCRAEQGRQWAVRMMHEARMHENSCFITLTYDEKRIPKNAALCPKDLSRFIKDLRKTQQRRISFFGCGEYGEKTQRPHYHALLFGIEFLDRDIGVNPGRPSVWRSKALDDVWGMGITEGGSVTMGSASYVAGYIRKKVRKKDYARANPYSGELLEPEFARMSLKPAIGKRWIEKYWEDVYPRDFVVIDGYEAKPPRYYDKWMDKNHPDIMEDVRQKRFEEKRDMTKYSMMSAEKTHEARVELFYGRHGL